MISTSPEIGNLCRVGLPLIFLLLGRLIADWLVTMATIVKAAARETGGEAAAGCCRGCLQCVNEVIIINDCPPSYFFHGDPLRSNNFLFLFFLFFFRVFGACRRFLSFSYCTRSQILSKTFNPRSAGQHPPFCFRRMTRPVLWRISSPVLTSS